MHEVIEKRKQRNDFCSIYITQVTQMYRFAEMIYIILIKNCSFHGSRFLFKVVGTKFSRKDLLPESPFIHFTGSAKELIHTIEHFEEKKPKHLIKFAVYYFFHAYKS